jgi:single-strand DNA-binding protein
MGNITRDPEVKHTSKGTAIADMSLAINRVFSDPAGNRQEETIFIDVTAWGKTAELCGKHLTKGSAVLIEGRLHQDQWEDKATGQKRSKLKVVAENIQFVGSKPSTAAPRQAATQTTTASDDFDDIPF